jgi:CRP-like cAMP-binding protein
VNTVSSYLMKRNEILASLSGEDREALAPHLSPVVLESKQRLHHPGEEIGYLHFPTDGLVSYLRHFDNGEMVECGMVGRDGAVGLLAALGPSRASMHAIVQITGAAMRISKDHFVRRYEASRGLREIVANAINKQMMQAERLAACNAVHSAEARLCRCMLQAFDRTGVRRLAIAQETFAQMLGIMRTSVTLLEKRLVEQGLVRVGRGSLHILDRDGLAALACECYRPVPDELAPTARELTAKTVRPNAFQDELESAVRVENGLGA